MDPDGPVQLCYVAVEDGGINGTVVAEVLLRRGDYVSLVQKGGADIVVAVERAVCGALRELGHDVKVRSVGYGGPLGGPYRSTAWVFWNGDGREGDALERVEGVAHPHVAMASSVLAAVAALTAPSPEE
ncbi:MAG: hypothetical protein OEV37_02765 [Candidatus Berkelbacteria bacterium]|nr:hypothetical protein [Candidatus Berkelbacteria bacterium]